MCAKEGEWHAPGDAAAELSKALVERQQLAKCGEALRDYRREIAHVVHQLPLQAQATIPSDYL